MHASLKCSAHCFILTESCCRVRKMVDDYKSAVEWDDKHFIGVHIRRTDLAITAPDVSPHSPFNHFLQIFSHSLCIISPSRGTKCWRAQGSMEKKLILCFDVQNPERHTQKGSRLSV